MATIHIFLSDPGKARNRKGQGQVLSPSAGFLSDPKDLEAEGHPIQMLSKKPPAAPLPQERQCSSLGAGMGLKKRRKRGAGGAVSGEWEQTALPGP